MRAVQIIFVSLALAACANAGAVYAPDYYAYPKYSFAYGVSDKLTGDQKSHHETRDGGVVKGSYSLVQPDGVLRTVNYVADPIHGFQAQVINSAPSVHVAPVIKKAIVPAIAPVVGHHAYGLAKPVAIHHHGAPYHHGYVHGGIGGIGHAGLAHHGYHHGGYLRGHY